MKTPYNNAVLIRQVCLPARRKRTVQDIDFHVQDCRLMNQTSNAHFLIRTILFGRGRLEELHAIRLRHEFFVARYESRFAERHLRDQLPLARKLPRLRDFGVDQRVVMLQGSAETFHDSRPR